MFLPYIPITDVPIKYIYVTPNGLPVPKIFFDNKFFFFWICPKNESNFPPILLVYF